MDPLLAARAQMEVSLGFHMIFAGAAAPEATLRFILWTLPFGFALLLPSLWLLFKVFKGETFGSRASTPEARRAGSDDVSMLSLRLKGT